MMAMCEVLPLASRTQPISFLCTHLSSLRLQHHLPIPTLSQNPSPAQLSLLMMTSKYANLPSPSLFSFREFLP